MRFTVAHFFMLLFVVAGLLFIWIGVALGAQLPKGSGPFYIMGAICFGISAAAWWRRDRFVSSPPREAPELNHLTWFQRKRFELAHFDLGRLNFNGWALFLSSIAIMMLLIIGAVQFLGLQGNGLAGRAIALASLVIAVLWFQLGKWLFERVGASIYRRSNDDATDENGR